MRSNLLTAACALALAGFSTSQVVINEVVYDAPGSDGGATFVELYGPGGFDVSGYTIQSIEGRTGSGGTCNPETIVLPQGTLIPADGFLVLADDVGDGTTLVANADLIIGDIDFENGPDAVQLLDASGNYVDAVAYGAVDTSGGAVASCNGQVWFEGTPARDPFAPLSIERCPAGTDTNDNSADFTVNIPTPGFGESCCTGIEWVNQGAGNSISGAGDSVGLDFFATPCGANQNYAILASLTDPSVVAPPAGFPVFDSSTPLWLDAATAGAPFIAWTGTLGADGRLVGTAALDFSQAPVPGVGPFSLYIGAVAFSVNPLMLYPTNHVEIIINP